MFDALLSGRITGALQLRTATTGAPFATFRMAVPTKIGDTLFCSCVTFSHTVIEALQSLQEGASVAVSGEASINTWRASDGAARYGLDVTVCAVLTASATVRKRNTAKAAPTPAPAGVQP